MTYQYRLLFLWNGWYVVVSNRLLIIICFQYEVKGELQFDNVRFSYPTRAEQTILQGIVVVVIIIIIIIIIIN